MWITNIKFHNNHSFWIEVESINEGKMTVLFNNTSFLSFQNIEMWHYNLIPCLFCPEQNWHIKWTKSLMCPNWKYFASLFVLRHIVSQKVVSFYSFFENYSGLDTYICFGTHFLYKRHKRPVIVLSSKYSKKAETLNTHEINAFDIFML